MPNKPLVIWRFRDGKPGHEQQSLGLVKALAELTPAEVVEFDVREQGVSWLDWMLGRYPTGLAKPRPDLVLGAGHATHLSLLAAKKAYAAKVLVLMRPSLPLSLFDFVVVPEHDGVLPSDKVIVSRGVLNPMRPGEKKPDSLLILLGGESKHHQWDAEAMQRQLESIIAAQAAGVSWRITDSRRTPAEFSAQLRQRYGERFMPWQDCPPGWLAQRLAVTETVWVSEDSVSMIYESLSAACQVGLLQLPAKGGGSGRLQRGIDSLVSEGWVMPYTAWQEKRQPLPAAWALNEAQRVAKFILAKLGSR